MPPHWNGVLRLGSVPVNQRENMNDIKMIMFVVRYNAQSFTMALEAC